tara:strand:+ start:3103 stop:3873 length:771 start_codon:yes stop_codon:yes gene_type:complete
MYRVSNGNTFTGKTELSKSFIVFTGNADFKRAISKDWKFMQKAQGNARVYFSNYIGNLNIFKKPLDLGCYEEISYELDLQNTNLIHPAIANSYYNELLRLYPKASSQAQKSYKTFIDFLIKKHQLLENNNEEKCNYIDDIGPYLIVKTGLKKSVIPELPQIYLAPKIWREMTWLINNYFIGPYPKNNKNIYYEWGGYNINSTIKKKSDESALFYLISKFIIIQEAWLDRSNCNSLINFINLIIEKKIKPTDKKFIG